MKAYTDKAKKAIYFANRLSKSMGYHYVGTEHMLLAALEDGESYGVRFLQMLGVRPNDAAAFGDNYNDREMLLAVGNGYLIDNAPAELKAQIKKHTKDNNRDGIYYALAELGFINE